MAKQLVKTYTLNVGSRTVSLDDYGVLYLERLQLIVNVTQNVMLYNFVDPDLANATIAGNVITLETMGNTVAGDKLMVIYDSAVNDPIYDWAGTVPLTSTTTDDKVTNYPHGYDYKILSADGVIQNSGCKLHGVFVTGGTPQITVYDNPSAASGNKPIDTFQTVNGYQSLGDMRMTSGAYLDITGTGTVVFLLDPTLT